MTFEEDGLSVGVVRYDIIKRVKLMLVLAKPQTVVFPFADLKGRNPCRKRRFGQGMRGEVRDQSTAVLCRLYCLTGRRGTFLRRMLCLLKSNSNVIVVIVLVPK